MIQSSPKIRQGGVAGRASSFRGLETHRFPRAVPIKRCELERRSLTAQLSPGSGEGQGSGTNEHRILIIQLTDTEWISNQPLGLPDLRPMTTVRARGRSTIRDWSGLCRLGPCGSS